MIRSTKHQQRGISILGWSIILSMAGIYIVVGLKMLPVYLEFYKVKDVMSSIASDNTIAVTAKKDIERALKKRLSTNDVRLTREQYKILKVKGRKSYAIKVDYKKETPLFSNISLVSHFDYVKEMGEAQQK